MGAALPRRSPRIQPDAAWNDESGRLFVYFHSDNSVTRWAETDDGVTFDYEGVAVEKAMVSANVTETSYARVFLHPDVASSGYAYAMFYMGNERNNVRRIRLAESADGKIWNVDREYVVAPGPEEGQNVSAPDVHCLSRLQREELCSAYRPRAAQGRVRANRAL